MSTTHAPIRSKVRSKTPIVTIRPNRDYPITSPTTRIDSEAEEARLARIERLESHLQYLVIKADRAEAAREREFRIREKERDRIFLENEERREQGAREMQQAIRDLVAAGQLDQLPQILRSAVDETTEERPPSGGLSGPKSILKPTKRHSHRRSHRPA